MKSILSYEKGHIIVAAIRILSYRENRFPVAAEVSDMTGIPGELAGMLLHELENIGIIRSIPSAFDARFELVDPAPLEDLPREEEGPKLREEVDEFHQKAKHRQEEMERMFADPEREQKRRSKMSKLEDELKRFKKEGRPPHPFAEDYD